MMRPVVGRSECAETCESRVACDTSHVTRHLMTVHERLRPEGDKAAAVCPATAAAKET